MDTKEEALALAERGRMQEALRVIKSVNPTLSVPACKALLQEWQKAEKGVPNTVVSVPQDAEFEKALEDAIIFDPVTLLVLKGMSEAGEIDLSARDLLVMEDAAKLVAGIISNIKLLLRGGVNPTPALLHFSKAALETRVMAEFIANEETCDIGKALIRGM